jgi:multiple sugar transport system ATP-binding protein
MTMGHLVAVLKKGVLQQVDGPQALYERPVNLFVAGFIGSPAMNLVEGRLEDDGGGSVAVFGGNRLRLDDALVRDRPGLRTLAGRELVIGIRPEDMDDPAFATGPTEGRLVRGLVDRREPMGAEVVLHFTVDAPLVLTEDTRELAADTGAEALHRLEQQAAKGQNRFVARVNPRSAIDVGQQVELAVDTARLHFFDPETGEAIYGTEARAISVGVAPAAHPS